MRAAALLLAGIAVLALPGCKRERRQPRPTPVASEQPAPLSLATNHAGLAATPPQPRMGQQYEESAYHVSEGKRLFTWFNCVGCHGNGGGGSGPPLMDSSWIYGSEMQNIVATILQGRPNGMPSFRQRVPEEQVWQIAAYVRSMGRTIPQDVAPSRSDDMHARPAENRLPAGTPDTGAVPSNAVTPSP